MLKRTCTGCDEELTLDHFYKSKLGKYGHCSRCKKCTYEQTRRYRATKAGRDKTREIQRKYYHNTGGFNRHRRNKDYQRKFGITLEDYQTMFKAQGGACKICGNTDAGAGRRLHIDHCHSTGKIRGLLCQHCNTGLGQFKDSPDTLQRAITYLKGNK